MSSCLRALPVVLMVWGSGWGQLIAHGAGDDPVLVTYDVGDLVQSSTSWRMSAMRQSELQSDRGALEDLIQVIMQQVPAPFRDRKNGSLHVLNERKLEIRAPGKQQEEIQTLLDALRRLNDVKVFVSCELHEVDRDFFKRDLETRLLKPRNWTGKPYALPLQQGAEQVLRAKSSATAKAETSLANGLPGQVFSLRQALLYQARPRALTRDESIYDSVIQGVNFKARPVVSADRRRITLKLTQHTCEVLAIKKKSIEDPLSSRTYTVEEPEKVEGSDTATVEVEDGQCLLALVPYGASAKTRDRVQLLLIKPSISIRAEEEARKKQSSR